MAFVTLENVIFNVSFLQDFKLRMYLNVVVDVEGTFQTKFSKMTFPYSEKN